MVAVSESFYVGSQVDFPFFAIDSVSFVESVCVGKMLHTSHKCAHIFLDKQIGGRNAINILKLFKGGFRAREMAQQEKVCATKLGHPSFYPKLGPIWWK